MPADDRRASADYRIAHERWRTWIPLGAVVLALLALVLLPVVRAAYVGPLYDDMRTVTEPSRSLLTRIHVALALEQSLLRDYLESGDSVAVARYHKAVEEEREAYAELDGLVSQLGPAVRREFAQLREVEQGWHSEVDKFLVRSRAGRMQRDPLHAKLYEEVLLGVARLDEALNAAAGRRWAEISATNRAQEWITIAVGVLALGAAITVALLGRRLRTYAVSEESARRSLEEATESRERLMRGITHDLKNPLHAISGHAEMLENGMRGPLNEAQLLGVGSIRSSVRHLLSMITDLIELSRAEGGQLSIRPAETSIATAVGEIAREHGSSAGQALLTIETAAADDLPVVFTDVERVKQVLQNLVSNAIKYTPPGGTITIAASARRPPEAPSESVWVAVDVQDTGTGIPENQLDAIFEEFSRLDSHRGKPGAGLGLAIARRVAGLLGGEITVTSSPHGSVFTFWIPQDRRAGPGSSGRVP